MFKSFTVAALISLTSTTVFASEAHSFKADDASTISRVCEVAANQGLSAARKEGARHGVFISRFSETVRCNGEDIRTFAKTQSEVQTEKQASKSKLVAKNSSVATELCMKAAKEGIESLKVYRGQARSLKCNDLPVKQFVQQINKTAL
ncbi:exonuclease III [Pseudoalteromonas obscura]|uniref:Exonuclease III n=1 Tax=Pseudoalteromonas obscura TaxID=3048491 RepID=A0ABT7EEX4_9GAMM|nr:exonuclease III [Pseudoalteromonas sp. P94(2023)]MDK2593831.1 exonuclease III [Pseudoalteromonas sp. P94(2023)]